MVHSHLMLYSISRVLCVALLGTAAANAAVVANWDFATAQTGPLSSYAAASRDSHVTSALLATSGGGAQLTTSAVGGFLRYSWNGNQSADLNGAFVQLDIAASGADFSGFTVSYATASTVLSGLNGTWAYSINGAAATPLSPETITLNGANSDSLGSLALASGQTLRLTFTLSGAIGGNSGSMSFDNFDVSASTITPVPEPVNVALGFFAVLAIGMTVGRRLLKARQA